MTATNLHVTKVLHYLGIDFVNSKCVWLSVKVLEETVILASIWQVMIVLAVFSIDVEVPRIEYAPVFTAAV